MNQIEIWNLGNVKFQGTQQEFTSHKYDPGDTTKFQKSHPEDRLQDGSVDLEKSYYVILPPFGNDTANGSHLGILGLIKNIIIPNENSGNLLNKSIKARFTFDFWFLSKNPGEKKHFHQKWLEWAKALILLQDIFNMEIF